MSEEQAAAARQERRICPRVREAIYRETWAIYGPALEQLVAIADRQGDVPSALAAREGRALDDAERVQVRDDVAIIPVTGPIFRYANLFTEISGATALSTFRMDLARAADDPSIRAILLDINSPGGQHSGISEAADAIRAAHRSDRPVVAYVGGMAASAGYWLAAAAGELVIEKTAQLGSIGVVMGYVDRSEQERRDGVRRFEIVSSQSPNKRPDPNTDDGHAQYQRLVDRLADGFIEAVAAFRGTSPPIVAETFGRGGLEVGIDAVKLGMADRLGTLEGVLAELVARQGNFTSRGMMPAVASGPGVTMSTAKETTVSLSAITVAWLRDNCAGIVGEIEATARAAGVDAGSAAERARILGIEGNALPGHEQLVAQLKADGKTTPDQAAGLIIKAERELGGQHLAANRQAAAEQAVVPTQPAASGASKVKVDPNLPVEERAKATWDGDPDIRAEFRTFGAYLAYAKREGTGAFKIKSA